MIVAIHQPNFFPWLPFYEKIKAADVFVFLRNCQFEKNNYQNRFHYRDRWHTMSVNKGLEPIVDKRYVGHEKDWNKIKTNLRDKKLVLADYDSCINDSLYETNHNIIIKTLKKLNIHTAIEYDSSTNLASTDRLVEICKSLNATTYLAGRGGTKYMDMNKFEEAGIKVEIQTVSVEQSIHVLDIL
jgi:hypothetical protein